MNETAARGTSRRERGAVLVVALILLVVLTLLGVTAMNTTQLEERMAANSQETNRAFQAAETGLSQAFTSESAWVETGFTSAMQGIPGSTAGDETAWVSRKLDIRQVPPGSKIENINSLPNVKAAYFDFASTGRTGAGIETTVHGGGWTLTGAQSKVPKVESKVGP